MNIVKSFNLPHGQNGNSYHKTISDMKSHIKKVLNMHVVNSSLDKYIEKVFNFHSLNPTYMFRLPDGKNRTVMFKKSDFSIAVFPNITNVSKFKQNTNFQASSSNRHQVKVKSEEIIDELQQERLIFQKNLNGNLEDSDYDDNMRNIVDSNVRAEKEFINFIGELNQDLDEDELHEKYNQRDKGKAPKDEWDEVGLSGWSGTMTANKDELNKKER